MRTKNFARIGLSLSLCIRDVLEGLVTEDEIVCILTATLFDGLDEAIEYYGESYWGSYSEEEVREVLGNLWPRILQPRGYGILVSQADGYWLDLPVNYTGRPQKIVGDEIVWA